MEIDGAKLKAAREEALLSVRELSERSSGVAHTTIVRIEGMERANVHPRTLRRLASALGVEAKSLRADR